MLADWHEFYGLLGTAAAALVALLFVAASIGANVLRRAESAGATRTYHEPGGVPLHQHLVSQSYRAHPDADLADLRADDRHRRAGSIIYSIIIRVRVLLATGPVPTSPDRLCYGADAGALLASYVAGLCAPRLHSQAEVPDLELMAGGGASVAPVINIRNAWDLTDCFVAWRRP